MMLKLLRLACAAAGASGLIAGSPAAAETELELWRLDCGAMTVRDIGYFSDAYRYEGRSAELTNGCYLVRHGDRYLLWDAGLPADLLGNTEEDEGWVETLSVTIADQLRALGLAPADVGFLGVSHFHGDHIGQAADFAGATLLMSEADASFLRSRPPGNARRRLAAWFDDGGAAMTEFRGDHDVFGDGSVTILAMPGHTPGHGALLVRLPETGPVLITGDLFHFRAEIGARNVSRWNTSRADTLASIERFAQIVAAIDPLVVVQHEPEDVALLPAFPLSAK